MAHEILNSLSPIRGFARPFLRRLQEGSEEARYAEVMIQEVGRPNRVIANFLDFAWRGGGRRARRSGWAFPWAR